MCLLPLALLLLLHNLLFLSSCCLILHSLDVSLVSATSRRAISHSSSFSPAVSLQVLLPVAVEILSDNPPASARGPSTPLSRRCFQKTNLEAEVTPCVQCVLRCLHQFDLAAD